MTHDMREPLKRAKGLGSAKDGTDHWIAQRITSVAVAVFGLVIIGWLTQNYQLPRDEMVKAIGNPWASSIVLFFVASASYHAALGLQVIIEDYVHSHFWKYWLVMKVRLTGYILPVITLFILIQFMFMGSK